MYLADLANSLAYGDTFARVASFLCRDEDEVRQKAKSLGWSNIRASGRHNRGEARLSDIGLSSEG
jgi:hypothetical protein